MNAGGDSCARGEDAEAIPNVFGDYFKPEALDHVYQQVTKFLQYRRTGQTTGRDLLEFGFSRLKAEARALMGGAFPDGFAPTLFMQNEALSRNDKSSLLASA